MITEQRGIEATHRAQASLACQIELLSQEVRRLEAENLILRRKLASSPIAQDDVHWMTRAEADELERKSSPKPFTP